MSALKEHLEDRRSGIHITTETVPLIFSKISAIMSEMHAVPKTGTANAKVGGYKYRTIEDIKNASNPIFAKHEVFYSPEVLEHKSEIRETNAGGKMLHHTIRVRYKIHTTDGSFVEAVVFGEAADSGDKGLGKAQTYAEKVMLIQLLNIPTQEQALQDTGTGGDPDHQQPQFTHDEPPNDMDCVETHFLEEELPPHRPQSNERFVMKIPKNRYVNQTFDQMGKRVVQENLGYWIQRIEKDGKPPKGAVKEFIEAAQDWLKLQLNR